MEILSDLAIQETKEIKRLVVARAIRDLLDCQLITPDTSYGHRYRIEELFRSARLYVRSEGFQLDCEAAGLMSKKAINNLEDLISKGEAVLIACPLPDGPKAFEKQKELQNVINLR